MNWPESSQGFLRNARRSEHNENIPAGTPTVRSTPRIRRATAFALMADSFRQHGAKDRAGIVLPKDFGARSQRRIVTLGPQKR